MQGSFKLYSTWWWSYIFATQKLYCCYAAVILYSPPKLGEAQYHLRSKYNWRSQYNSPKANITEKNGNRITITVLFWQRMRDSNPRERSQSPVCYRYTNPLRQAQVSLYSILRKSQALFSQKQKKFLCRFFAYKSPAQG